MYRPGEDGFEIEDVRYCECDTGPPRGVGDAAAEVAGASDIARGGGGRPQPTVGEGSVQEGRSTHLGERGDAHGERASTGGRSRHEGGHHHRRHRRSRHRYHRPHGEASNRVPQSGFDFDALFPPETDTTASEPQQPHGNRSNGEGSTRVPQSGFDFDALF